MKFLVLMPLFYMSLASAEGLIKVETYDYQTNDLAGFCTRPLEMIDTIVIHHSETPVTDTPAAINHMHLGRGSKDSPWYMIAYHYVINSPYKGQISPIAQITEARPLSMVGAHAGSEAFVEMDNEQQKLWNADKILCGRKNTPFKKDPLLLREGKIKANVTTIGLVVIGNYGELSPQNLSGYLPAMPNEVSIDTLDMIARLSCQLQKKHPRIKNLKWHSYYHSEKTCPGDLKDSIGKIREMVKEYGCAFN